VIRLGLVGCGRWGRNIIATTAHLEGARLVAVASSNPVTRDLTPPHCKVFPTWQHLMNSNHIDGLIIASPAHTHAEISLTAMDHRIPILIEKPMALSTHDAERLMQSSIKNKTYATVNHIHLFNPAFRRLLQIIPKYGSISSISAIAGGPGPFRSDCSVLWDWAPHDIAMVLKITGKIPTNVICKKINMQSSASEYAEHISLRLEFKSDLEAILDISNNRISKMRSFQVVAEHGTLLYDDCAQQKLISSRPEEDVSYASTPPLLCAINDFVNNISTPSDDISGLKIGLDVIKIIDSVYFR